MPTDQTAVDRLAASRDNDGQAFLGPHHVQAAQRLERLIRRAQLAPRLTMSYDPARVGSKSGGTPGDIADSASHARQRLNRLAAQLPPDCWGVLFDVCGAGKGLQAVETERRWPRRSAKLVLRIGLSQLAAQLGLLEQAAGPEHLSARTWRSERLPIIAEDCS
jgi:hypothetical protein